MTPVRQSRLVRVLGVVTQTGALVACFGFLAAMLNDWVRPEDQEPLLVERLVTTGLVGVGGAVAIVGAVLLGWLGQRISVAEQVEASRQLGWSFKKFGCHMSLVLIVASFVVALSLVGFVANLREWLASP
jgi:hypothetical protein